MTTSVVEHELGVDDETVEPQTEEIQGDEENPAPSESTDDSDTGEDGDGEIEEVELAPVPTGPTVTLATVPGNYPAQATRQRVAERIAALRAVGWTRPALKEFTGFGGSALWRAEGGRVHTHEVRVYDEFFTLVDAGSATPPSKVGGITKTGPRVAELERELAGERLTAQLLASVQARAYDLLNVVAVNDKVTKAQVMTAIFAALELLEPTPEPDPDSGARAPVVDPEVVETEAVS